MHEWTYVHWQDILWFIQNFNPATRVLQFTGDRNIVVTSADIQDIFLLPKNDGKSIVLLGKNDESATAFLEDFKARYKFKQCVDVDVGSVFKLLMDKEDVNLKDGGEDFKRLFVLFSLSSFLTSTQNSRIELSIIKSLIDVSQIASFDWCTFVLEKLCKAISSFKNKPNPKNLNGCPLILPLLYFHRFMWLGFETPCTLPLIQHWTSTTFSKRLRDELIGNSGFGVGKWVENKYPISAQVQGIASVDDVHAVERGDECDDIPHDEEDEDNADRECINYKIPQDEKTNEEIKSIAKNGLDESYLLLKRDINVITHHHIKRLMKHKLNSKQKCATNNTSSPPSPADGLKSEDSNDFFSHLDCEKHIDEVVDRFLKLKKLYRNDDCPKFDLLTPESKNQTMEDDEKDCSVDEKDCGIDDISPGVFTEGPCHQMNTNVEIDNLLASVDRRKLANQIPDDKDVDLVNTIADPFHICPTDWTVLRKLHSSQYL